jgi:hypothetical protein
LTRARPRIPADGPILRRAGEHGEDVVYLALPHGHVLSSIQFTEPEWERVRAWQRGDGTGVGIDLAVKVARAGLLDV